MWVDWLGWVAVGCTPCHGPWMVPYRHESTRPKLHGKVELDAPPKKLETTSLEARPKARPPIPPKASVEERGTLRKAEMHSMQEKMARIQSTTEEERSMM